LLRVRIYSNLINGVNHTFRQVQAHQISPDMDEIVPFAMDVRLMFNDFLNIEVSFGLFQNQAFGTQMYVIANIFSSLVPQVIDYQEGGLLDTVAEFPNNLIYFCNAWFCGFSSDSIAGCFDWPETDIPQLDCHVPTGDADSDNYYHQYLRFALFFSLGGGAFLNTITP
jgi:hypothetical protein